MARWERKAGGRMEADADAMTPRLARQAWDSQMRRVIASVEAPDYDTQRLRAILPWLTLLACVMAAGGLAIVWVIWRQAMADLWLLFWVALAVCSLITLFLIGSIAQRRSNSPFVWETLEALIVRAATVADDQRIAPFAPTQPSPADDAWGALGAQRVRGLYRPSVSLNRQTIGTLVIGLIVVLSIQLLPLMPFTSADEAWAALPVVGVLAMAAGAGLILWLMRLPFNVVVGADGVRWRRRLRWRMLRWNDAQALCVVGRRDKINRRSQRIYWLQGADGALVWASRWVAWERELLPGEDDNLVDPSDPAWRLCALAATKTGQRLRDLTATISSLVTVGPSLAAKWRTLAPGFIAPLGSEAHARIVRLRAAHLWRLKALTTALLALNLTLLGAGLGLLVVAPRAYGAQLAWAQRQTPIFADALTPATGQWSDASAMGSVFEPFGNTSAMVTDGYGNFALAAPYVRDGVVEVTVHHVAGSEYDSDGIILRGDQMKNRILVFAITADGIWTLDRLALKPDSDGFGPDNSLIRQGTFIPVMALRQGDKAVNRLAVIMRGGDYTFFINGQYVGSYYETRDTGARVGVAAEGDSELVGFSDFAVYPAPPASPLFPV